MPTFEHLFVGETAKSMGQPDSLQPQKKLQAPGVPVTITDECLWTVKFADTEMKITPDGAAYFSCPGNMMAVGNETPSVAATRSSALEWYTTQFESHTLSLAQRLSSISFWAGK